MGGQTLYISCKRQLQLLHYFYVLSCIVGLWDIFLYFVVLRTCVVIRLSNWHVPNMRSWLIHSNRFSSPIVHLWYHLQRRISAQAKLHTTPPRHSHRGGGAELAQDPGIQTAVWMGLLINSVLGHFCVISQSWCWWSILQNLVGKTNCFHTTRCNKMCFGHSATFNQFLRLVLSGQVKTSDHFPPSHKQCPGLAVLP